MQIACLQLDFAHCMKRLGLYSPSEGAYYREIRVYNFAIALKFDGHIGSSTAEMPLKF